MAEVLVGSQFPSCAQHPVGHAGPEGQQLQAEPSSEGGAGGIPAALCFLLVFTHFFVFPLNNQNKMKALSIAAVDRDNKVTRMLFPKMKWQRGLQTVAVFI